MRNRFISVIPAFVAALVLSPACIAHAQDDKDKFKARYEALAGNKEFDPHDLSGIWTLTRNDHTLGTPAPPLTPAGVAAMAGRIFDPNGARGKAPRDTCNPTGFPTLPYNDEATEIIIVPHKNLQAL